ncbi:uncharacterized protein B0H64DRAFT_436726 [Chaetomium fimeti]|uniref:Cyanovirin-N domain-containing protein n=1 Tax=Chaetomium fimeti TaxID=1854472 RepID=A0AAE0LMB4_9PEZI|nr:hypothetical protein B0H64DRAFT_436726 [Chaetomium fimeti]
MHITAPFQLLLVALAATQSSASPLAAPAPGEVEARTITHNTIGKRSFWTSCNSCSIGGSGDNPYLLCMCRRTNGLYSNAQLYLNTCLANRNGKLSWARNGNFGRSCWGHRVESDGWFVSTCSRSGGSTMNGIPLKHVHNRDGALVCSGF